MFKQTIQSIQQERDFLRYENGRTGREVKNYGQRMALLKKIEMLCKNYEEGNYKH